MKTHVEINRDKDQKTCDHLLRGMKTKLSELSQNLTIIDNIVPIRDDNTEQFVKILHGLHAQYKIDLHALTVNIKGKS